uniref:Exocyst subunit Exo70 family protein n=1 Tax=Aegilops tauschii TaxID=37682 RepID=M8BW83_AEGTA
MAEYTQSQSPITRQHGGPACFRAGGEHHRLHGCVAAAQFLDSIRSVSIVYPEWRIRSTLSSQSSQSGSSSNYDSSSSGASRSNNSGYYSNSASVGPADLGTIELTKIAHRMVRDGYTQRMVRAFHNLSLTETTGPYPALKNWFIELDVDWVLQPLQFQLQHGSGYWLQEMVERWIRALTIIVSSIGQELITTRSGAPAAARFATASVSAMLVFVDAIVQFHRVENLRARLQMYMCVCSASAMLTMHATSSGIFNKICGTLESQGNRLIESICDTMVRLRQTLMNDVNSWATKIPRGKSEVHKNTRMVVDYITLMKKAHALAQKNSTQSYNTKKLRQLIDYTIDNLNNLLLRRRILNVLCNLSVGICSCSTISIS